MTSLDKKHIQRSFNCVATTYAQAAVVQQHVGQQLLERVRYIKLDPTVVIDLGAGPGVLTVQLQQHYPRAQVTAVDFAWGMMQQAKTQNISAVCADAYQLPFATHSVDCVVSHCMLQWCDELSMVFREIQRVLRPEGLFMFTTLGPDTFKELRDSWAHVDDRIHVHTFTDMHDIGDALLQTQFRDPVMDRELMRVHYQEIKTLWQDVRATGVQNRAHERLKGLLGKTAWRQFCEAYATQRTEQGKYPLSYEIIYGHAWASDLATQMYDPDTQATYVSLDQLRVKR